MYKATVRRLVRHGISRLNAGDPSFLLRRAAPDAELRFPGDNSWAAMFRPVEKGAAPHATHRGIDECRAFADRFVAEGHRLEVEDILVNGAPWHTRIAVRCQSFGPGYENRAVAFLELRWGRLRAWEDYEDTERVAALDARRIDRDTVPA